MMAPGGEESWTTEELRRYAVGLSEQLDRLREESVRKDWLNERLNTFSVSLDSVRASIATLAIQLSAIEKRNSGLGTRVASYFASGAAVLALYLSTRGGA